MKDHQYVTDTKSFVEYFVLPSSLFDIASETPFTTHDNRNASSKKMVNDDCSNGLFDDNEVVFSLQNVADVNDLSLISTAHHKY